jgi:hypothetical protein
MCYSWCDDGFDVNGAVLGWPMIDRSVNHFNWWDSDMISTWKGTDSYADLLGDSEAWVFENADTLKVLRLQL